MRVGAQQVPSAATHPTIAHRCFLVAASLALLRHIVAALDSHGLVVRCMIFFTAARCAVCKLQRRYALFFHAVADAHLAPLNQNVTPPW